jgi:hypothetical protein
MVTKHYKKTTSKKLLSYEEWRKRNMTHLQAEYCDIHPEEFDHFCRYQWGSHNKVLAKQKKEK